MTEMRYVSKSLLVLAALALGVGSWALVGYKITHPVPVTLPPSGLQARAIAWDNRVFSSRTALASWLASRGTTYRRWARQHPADAAIVEHVPARAFTPPTHQAAGKPARSGPQRAATARKSSGPVAARAPSAGTSASLRWAPILLLVLGAVVMLAAVIPAPLVQLPRGDWFSATHRTYVFALGFSIAIGVLIAGFHA
jgi:hypothetical protein